jgi:outer membrane immunogenic protein
MESPAVDVTLRLRTLGVGAMRNIRHAAVVASAFLAIGALTAGGPASAADMPVKAPVYKAPIVAPVYNWTGFYAGASAGFGWGTGSIELSPLPGFFIFYAPAIARGEIPGSSDLRARGFIGGMQTGYNYQSGSIVYGLEADISYARIRGTASNVSNGLLNPVITTTQEEQLDWLGTLRGRIGFAPTPSWLAYLTGGLAFGRGAASTTTAVAACPNSAFCSTGSFSKTLVGWTVGGGLEYALGRNWSTKFEYLYYDLGHESYITITPGAAVPTPVMQADATFKGHIARIGLNYRFDWGGPVYAKY